MHMATSFDRSDSPFVTCAYIHLWKLIFRINSIKIILDKVYIYTAVISGLKLHARRVCDNKE